jgi:pimeloyl-ACP methyl ester carboxylesterase
MLQMQAIATHNTSARLGAITAPTLVIHGTEDRMLAVANGRSHRRRDPRRPPRAARGRRPHVLVGAARRPSAASLVAAHALGERARVG